MKTRLLLEKAVLVLVNEPKSGEMLTQLGNECKPNQQI